MKILAIETSCDETAAAVIEDGVKILSNIVASSAEMHAKTGGVIPEIAARQQLKSIVPVISEALAEAQVTPENLDAIAVTVGPGLIGSLLVGVETAKTLSLVWQKPILPVNHLVGHIYANWLEKDVLPEFPCLALVVSGGHTDLVMMESHGKIKWVGGTRDDAAGEAFDKTARLLSLPYPGGPNLSRLAQKYISKHEEKLEFFPRPIINENNYDWSFSGLKTAVARELQGKRLEEKDQEEMAAEVQEAIVDCLVVKTQKAIEDLEPKSFVLAGGVAANNRLREKFGVSLHEKLQVSFHVPEIPWCTDNGAYIGAAAYFLQKFDPNYRSIPWQEIVANPQLTIED